MKARFSLFQVIIIVLVCLFTLGGGIVIGQELVTRPETTAAGINSQPLSSAFSYQGKLELGGDPVNAACDFQFSLWDEESAGVQIGATQTITNVLITDGLFSTMLNDSGHFGTAAFAGDARYLQVAAGCPTGATAFSDLTPRQPLTAVPYAHTLRPGAAIRGSGTALTVENTSTNGSAMVVTGHSTSSTSPALKVNLDGAGGYAFDVVKTNGAGVAGFARNNGATGSGAAGYSDNWFGVYGYTGTSSNNYGFYSPDNLYTRNINMVGPTMIVAQNGGEGTLNLGDVVSFSGISSGAESDGQPIVQVAPTTSENSAGVAGVVYGSFHQEWLNAPPEGFTDPALSSLENGGPAAPGEYLLLVIYGPAQVKVDAKAQGIEPGALLTASSGGATEVITDGVVVPGTVFGKALETAAPEKSLMYVFVTLQ